MNDDDQDDAVFQALASRSRRQMLDSIRDRPGISVGKLAAGFDVSRVAVIKHLRTLERADLVISQRDGRRRRLYINAVPIVRIHARWTTQYSAELAGRLVDLKDRLEQVSAPMTTTQRDGGETHDGKS